MAESPTLVPAGTWIVDIAHSHVGFKVKRMGLSILRGHFDDFAGTLVFDDDLSAAKTYGTIKIASIDTEDEVRDEHLLAPDFFDAESHPEMKFESTAIRATDDDEFEITGNLTMHGVSREITLEAEVTGTDVDDKGLARVGLEVTGELSRAAYGLKFNAALGTGDLVVADKVKVAIDIEAIKQA